MSGGNVALNFRVIKFNLLLVPETTSWQDTHRIIRGGESEAHWEHQGPVAILLSWRCCSWLVHTWTNMLLSRFSSDPEGKIRALAKKNKIF